MTCDYGFIAILPFRVTTFVSKHEMYQHLIVHKSPNRGYIKCAFSINYNACIDNFVNAGTVLCACSVCVLTSHYYVRAAIYEVLIYGECSRTTLHYKMTAYVIFPTPGPDIWPRLCCCGLHLQDVLAHGSYCLMGLCFILCSTVPVCCGLHSAPQDHPTRRQGNMCWER